MEKYFEEKKEDPIPSEKSSSQRRSLSNPNLINLSAEIRLSRVFYFITLLSLKNQLIGLYFAENPPDKNSQLSKKNRIIILKQYLLILLRIWFRYMTVYIRFVEEKNTHDTINPEFNTFPSVSSGEEENKQKTTLLERKLCRSTRRLLTFPKFEADRKENTPIFLSYLEFLKNFDVKAIKKLNLKFEIEEFIILLLKTLIGDSVLLKKEGKFRESFVVLNCAFNNGKFFESTSVISYKNIPFSLKIKEP